MDRAGGQKDVDPSALGFLESLPSSVDIAVIAAGQTADDRASDARSDLAYGFEIPRACDRKTGLHDVDSQIREGLSDLEFFGKVHACPGGLFTVSEGCIEDLDNAWGWIAHKYLGKNRGWACTSLPLSGARFRSACRGIGQIRRL